MTLLFKTGLLPWSIGKQIRQAERFADTIRIASLLTFGATAACAQQPGNAVLPFNAPAGFAITSGTQLDQAGIPLLYGAALPTANWRIAQWNNPNDLPPMLESPVPGSVGSANANASARISQTQSGAVITFAASGRNVACTGPSGNPREFDLLASPTLQTATTYPTALNKAYYGNLSSFPNLGQLASFDASGSFTLNYPHTMAGVTPCPVNQAVASLNLILTNISTSPAQVFWYSVHLSYYCPTQSNNYGNCAANETRALPNWFWRGVQNGTPPVVNFGLDDTAFAYGYTPIEDNASHYLNLHLLPELIKVITAGQIYGMDANPSHWRLTGYQIGQALWGKIYMSSVFQGFNPSWVMKG